MLADIGMLENGKRRKGMKKKLLIIFVVLLLSLSCTSKQTRLVKDCMTDCAIECTTECLSDPNLYKPE